MSIEEFLSGLERRGVRIWADGESLRYDAPADLLTPGFIAELRERKEEVLGFLRRVKEMSTPELEPIPQVSRIGPLISSFAQRRLWFMNQLAPSSAFYNVPAALRLEGVLDRSALQRSLNELVERHEALRTSFIATSGEPFQVIGSPEPVTIVEKDLSALNESDRESEAGRLLAAEVQRTFDLSRGPLLRCGLFRLGDRDHILALTMHHIISDGWSIGVLVRDLAALYDAAVSGVSSNLDELPIQYADFAAWQRNWLQGEALSSQLAYWQRQLQDLPTLQLPTDRLRPAIPSYRGSREMLVLSEELTSALKELGRREGATLYMLLLAAFASSLHCYTGQEDIVVGSPVANRNRSELENLIGFFVNSLVMRTAMGGDPNIRELIARVRDSFLNAYAHQDLPFERLVEELHPDRDLTRNPLFQIMFAVQNAPLPPMRLGGSQLTLMWGETLATRFDLEVHIWEESDQIKIYFVYSTDLFEAATIKRMAGHYETILRAMVADRWATHRRHRAIEL